MGESLFPLSTEINAETAEAISENISESIHALSGLSLTEIAKRFIDFFTERLPSLSVAILFFVFGYVLVKLLMRFIHRLLIRSNTDSTLHSFILSTIKIVLYVILCITCIGILGINFTPLIAALGALGLAVSLAVRDILANIAGGISVLLSHPFSKGDYVEINGQPGTIREIGMVYTILQTVDNKKTYLPNGDVAKATIINYSAEPHRRLDITFTISQNSDFYRAKALAGEIIDRTPLALKDPAPVIRFSDQTFAFVKMTVYVWAENANLLELKSELITDIRQALHEESTPDTIQ